MVMFKVTMALGHHCTKTNMKHVKQSYVADIKNKMFLFCFVDLLFILIFITLNDLTKKC